MKIQILQDIIDIIRGKKKLIEKPTIPFLVFWVGTKCTLKCKICCNLIPYVNQVSYNEDEIIEDLKFLTENSNVKSLQIQGGKPFTHPNISKIISEVAKLNAEWIEIATNGTVSLSSDVIKTLQNNPKINVRISNYECTETLRKRFIEQLEQNGIKYRVYEFMYKNNTWFYTGGIDEAESSDEQAKETYKKCDNKNCHTLVNGTSYVCGKVATIKELYNNNKRRKHYDEIQVRYIRNLSNPFKKYILRKSVKGFIKHLGKYKEQCKYCNIKPEHFPAAQQASLEELENAKNIINIRKSM